MLLEKRNSQIITRIIENKEGQKFLAHFLLTEVSGKIFAKLIKAEKIDNSVFSQTDKKLLKGIICSKCFKVNKNFELHTKTPYIKSGFFLTSQMTRAPSII